MTDLTPELDQQLRTGLAGICEIAGLTPSDPQLIKYTNNAVYRLHSERVVVRFGAGALARRRAAHVVNIGQWLNAHDAPVVKLVEEIPQPVHFREYSATIWTELPPPEPTWTGAELAIPLMDFHKMAPPANLRDWDPFGSARSRLAVADGLTDDDHRWLTEQWDAAESDFQSARSLMTFGLLHGDAYIGNLLRSRSGRFVLCDFDGTSRGPIEYDLVVAAVSAIRFGAHEDHNALAANYGTDVTTHPSWPVLRRIRELVLVTSVVPDLRRRPGIATIHAHRLANLRSHSEELWQRYK